MQREATRVPGKEAREERLEQSEQRREEATAGECPRDSRRSMRPPMTAKGSERPDAVRQPKRLSRRCRAGTSDGLHVRWHRRCRARWELPSHARTLGETCRAKLLWTSTCSFLPSGG